MFDADHAALVNDPEYALARHQLWEALRRSGYGFIGPGDKSSPQHDFENTRDGVAHTDWRWSKRMGGARLVLSSWFASLNLALLDAAANFYGPGPAPAPRDVLRAKIDSLATEEVVDVVTGPGVYVVRLGSMSVELAVARLVDVGDGPIVTGELIDHSEAGPTTFERGNVLARFADVEAAQARVRASKAAPAVVEADQRLQEAQKRVATLQGQRRLALFAEVRRQATAAPLG